MAEGILWFRLPLPMALDHVNVYALADSDGWTLVDTGFYSKRGTQLWQEILTGPLAGKPVKRLIVTHHHPDHVGNAGWFQREFGCELWMTRTSWLFARMLTLDVQDNWPSETLAFYRSTGMDKRIYEERRANRPFNFSDVVAPMPLGFKRIKQDDLLEFGGRRWRVEIGHGHAPEHATFWCDDDGLVLTGDQIIPGISSNLGVYATEPEADPVSDWLNSCKRLKKIANNQALALPGHKLPFTGVKARLRQLIDNHDHALERLLDHLSEPRSAADCFQPLFRRELSDGEYGLALVESLAHLNHLYLKGEVSRQKAGEVWLFQRSDKGPKV